ncbi:ABC transporter permease/substrate-binding protein [Paraliomyxa miuraensis]|uniref:ABC transporter permease/substrate-binding protein n=1 Tax=Paraliomyxa miuraensis TaxID=376150 RepID=UPI002259F23A|nr:ABC transporter permease/substrate-binding protein [Paraliomyxa miuraensis]MCX4240402.1 ABC transporter permease/substrate-binding protein [Paraliomyxa miuraensis]
MTELLARLPETTAAHLGLSLAALTLGVAVAVPLGVMAARQPRLAGPLVGVASVLQTIPGLALLAFMVPVLAALGLTSIGVLPALLGLFLYSLLPVLRNTITGLAGVDPAVREAALGVGMTPRESLVQAELPLALPVILAGIRISATWTVGTATLATPVGAPSLGSYIFGGLQTRNYAAVLVGCAASAVLALMIDGLLRALALGLERRRRRVTTASLAGLLGLGAIGASPAVCTLGTRDEAPIVIGAKTFSESQILAQVLAGRITEQTGDAVRTVDSLGSTVVFDALEHGQIDAYVDYSGTLWTTVLGRGEPRPGRTELLDEVGRALAEERGVHVVAALGFENTWVLAMPRAQAERLSVRRLGDLAPHAPRLRMGGDYEIFQRAEWAALVTAYDLRFAEQRTLDPSLMYEAVRSGQVDLVAGLSTDGRLAALDLVVLEDDRAVMPPYDAVILASERLRRERPDVIAAMRRLAGTIDDATMRELNRRVTEAGESPAAAAAWFLGRPLPP